MRGMTATLLVIGMMSPALAAEAPQSDIADLTAFADAFDAAQIAQDRAALDRMVADDLVFIDGSGKRYGASASASPTSSGAMAMAGRRAISTSRGCRSGTTSSFSIVIPAKAGISPVRRARR